MKGLRKDMRRNTFEDMNASSVVPPVGGIAATIGVSFFMFPACRPVSTAPLFLSSVSSVVPVMMLAQQHYRSVLSVEEKNVFNHM